MCIKSILWFLDHFYEICFSKLPLSFWYEHYLKLRKYQGVMKDFVYSFIVISKKSVEKYIIVFFFCSIQLSISSGCYEQMVHTSLHTSILLGNRWITSFDWVGRLLSTRPDGVGLVWGNLPFQRGGFEAQFFLRDYWISHITRGY